MVYVKRDNGSYVYHEDIRLWLPNYNDEKVVVISPHDDDALIGCGITLQLLKENDSEVYVFVLTDGSMGYTSGNNSDFNGKNNIVETRKIETVKAYEKIGIDKKHVIRFDYPDSELVKKLQDRDVQRGIIEKLRAIGVTRVFLPNENDFHVDHKIAYEVGLYCGIQATTGIMLDLGGICNIKSFLTYPVWMGFEKGIDYAVMTEDCYLERKVEGIEEYVGDGKSQQQMKDCLKEIKERGPYEYFLESRLEMFDGRKYMEDVFGNVRGNR